MFLLTASCKNSHHYDPPEPDPDVPEYAFTAITIHETSLPGILQIEGNIVDANKLPAGDVVIQALNKSTGEKSETKTTNTGFFSLSLPGAHGDCIELTAGQSSTIMIQYDLLIDESPATCEPVQILSQAPKSAMVHELYSYEPTVTGTPPFSWEIVTSVEDMLFDASSGNISWLPGYSGTYPIELQVTNGCGHAAENFTIQTCSSVNTNGGIGGCPVQGAVFIMVLDQKTLQPVPDAFVIIGEGRDIPFADNIQWTDSSGSARFQNTWLQQPYNITVGCTGYRWFTINNVTVDTLIIPLPPFVPTNSTNFSKIHGNIIQANAAQLNEITVGFVLKNQRLNDLLGFNFVDMLAEFYPLSLYGTELWLPGNIAIPQQWGIEEDYTLRSEKEPQTDWCAISGSINIFKLIQAYNVLLTGFFKKGHSALKPA
jgi:hypothetical protein